MGRSGVKDRGRTRKSGRPSLMAALANGGVRTEGCVGAGGEETWLEERTVFGEETDYARKIAQAVAALAAPEPPWPRSASLEALPTLR